MNAQISVFNFQSNKPVCVEYKDGEALFCLTDVANILDIKNANPLRFNLKNDGVHKMYSVDSKGRKNEITFINEPNLYRVIFRSNKPEAVKFQDWIFEEVIPQIRKTGTYTLTLTPEQKQIIREAVKARHYKTGEHWQAIYEKLHSYLRVNSYHEIQAKDFQAALDFLGSIPNAPEVVKQKELSPEIIRSIAYLLLYAQDMKLFVNRYLPAFENLGIDNRGALYSYIHDTIHVFDKVRDFVLPQLPISNEHWSKWGNTDYLRAKIVQTANV